MRRKLFFSGVALAIFQTTMFAANAQTLIDRQMAAVRLSIAEVVLATNSQLIDRTKSPTDYIDWSSDLSDRTWSLRMRGSSGKLPIQIEVTGFLWGGEAEDWIVTYFGEGKIAGELIRINGKVDWPLQKASSDRVKANFAQVTKFGEHSTWAWIVGSEVIVGAAIGAAAGIAVAALPPLAVVVVGLGGALGGSSATVTLSETVRTLIESDKPSSPPTQPPTPVPGKDEKIEPKDGILYAAITKNGEVVGSGPDSKYMLLGTAKDAKAMSGKVTMK